MSSPNDMGILSCPRRQYITAVHTCPHLSLQHTHTRIQIIMRGRMEEEVEAGEGGRGLCPLNLQDLPRFRTARRGGWSHAEQGYQWRHWKWNWPWPSPPPPPLPLLTKGGEGERERERGSPRSRELRRWIIPGAFPVPIEKGAPLDLSVVAAAVSGQNGPQWTWHLISLLLLCLSFLSFYLSLSPSLCTNSLSVLPHHSFHCLTLSVCPSLSLSLFLFWFVVCPHWVD